MTKKLDSYKNYFSDYTGYYSFGTGIYSLPENYLDVVNLKYFLPSEMESDLTTETRKLANGHYDYVQMLYSNTSIAPTSDGTLDPYKVDKANWMNLF